MGIVDRSVGRLTAHPHPSKLKEIAKILLQVSGVPVHLPPIRTSHSPPGLYNDCNGSETNGPLQRTQTSPIPGRLADKVPVSGGTPSEHSGGGRPNPVLGLDNKSGKIRTETYSYYEYHLDSALVKPTKESWLKLQDLILRLKSKHVLTARCLMSLIGLLASTEKMVPEGHLHMRPFQLHLKEHWRYPQSLDNLLPWTEAIAAHLDWWQNPSNMMKGADLHPKDHSIQLFTDASKEGWGAHLDQNSVVRPGETATHKRPRIEGGLTGPSKLQGPVPEPNSASCNGQLNSGSLHKQTRRNSLSRDVCSPVEDYDLVPSLSHNIESQTHSRVPECDGRPSVQVKPSAVNRMVTTSAGVQTDLPKVVHTSCRLICNSSEPQTSTVRISCPRPKGLGHRCSEHKLDESHCLCLPFDGSPSQSDPKNQAMLLPDHRSSPRLARDALVLVPSGALNRDPTATSGVNDSYQTVPQLCVPQQSTASQPPRLVSRSRQL